MIPLFLFILFQQQKTPETHTHPETHTPRKTHAPPETQ